MSSFSDYLEQASRNPYPKEWNLEAMEMSEEDIARDYERMKRLYPREARFVAAIVEDMCDQLEYEGSPMFDEQPDSVTIYRMAEEVYTRMKGKEGKPPKPDAPLMQLCMILICNEFHVRRCRYHQRKRRFW
ncbi:MAG: hypothetical protein J6B50_06245 [Lachnospiraceae bacterium]|nr:hypothetical protein [Lachnospiraceae bacterium]MBP3505613.1 hypothetical protein [Lachnospiraceae bacterium]